MQSLHILLVSLLKRCLLNHISQADVSQDPASISAATPGLEQRDEVYDPLATPDVNK